MGGMRGRIGGLVCAGALLLAAEAKAAPMALLDAPRATAVALAGSEVLVCRPASRGAARIDAVPLGGGPARARPRRGRSCGSDHRPDRSGVRSTRASRREPGCR
jgi:hypothetical protein